MKKVKAIRYFKLGVGLFALVCFFILLYLIFTDSDFLVSEAMFFTPDIPYFYISNITWGCLITLLVGGMFIISTTTLPSRTKIINIILICYFLALSILIVWNLYEFDWYNSLNSFMVTGFFSYFQSVVYPFIQLITFITIIGVLVLDTRMTKWGIR